MSAAGGNRRRTNRAPDSIVEGENICPFPCLNSHRAIYLKDNANPVGTFCVVCDEAFTRTFWLSELTVPRPDHRAT
jgi:hypothetical protein